MRKEKEIELNGNRFKIQSMPALMGRKMSLEYPIANAPKIGDYKLSESLALEMLHECVKIQIDENTWLPLDRTLINQHLDTDTLLSLEKEVFAFSTNFFTAENLSNLIGGITEIVLRQFTAILTEVLPPSSPKE